ncbi:unnamed protein product [Eruca vesicaria subsp. sativa]|uniref:Uncharacterized protein n=1 Tax=Eruca vesicaria subsp. sativa TaxID=29727 RepID=A0ABC8LBJ3_ERUVS|nr:unnamed protein product [Eruca vesicaria subsp. sativa]
MALSKLQSVVILVICSLLVTSQSRGLGGNAMCCSDCVYKGPCKSYQDCKNKCGPPYYPPTTIASCRVSPKLGNICCCEKN